MAVLVALLISRGTWCGLVPSFVDFSGVRASLLYSYRGHHGNNRHRGLKDEADLNDQRNSDDRVSYINLGVEEYKRDKLYIRGKMTVRDVDVPIPVAPEPPFPITTASCDVVCGFGRGSSELGIPTANVPMSSLPEMVNKLELGVYFGYAKLSRREDNPEEEEVERQDGRKVVYNHGMLLEQSNGDLDILPVVLSVGKNPFYNNDYKTVEIHILHDFHNTFYGARIKFNILGYIRPELNYTTKEALIEDINTDIDIARQVLDTEHYRAHMAGLI